MCQCVFGMDAMSSTKMGGGPPSLQGTGIKWGQRAQRPSPRVEGCVHDRKRCTKNTFLATDWHANWEKGEEPFHFSPPSLRVFPLLRGEGCVLCVGECCPACGGKNTPLEGALPWGKASIHGVANRPPWQLRAIASQLVDVAVVSGGRGVSSVTLYVGHCE